VKAPVKLAISINRKVIGKPIAVLGGILPTTMATLGEKNDDTNIDNQALKNVKTYSNRGGQDNID
jgi:hypothetical protein